MTIKELEDKLALHREIMKLYMEGYKTAEIAKRCKVKRQYVYWVIQENDPEGYENGGVE